MFITGTLIGVIVIGIFVMLISNNENKSYATSSFLFDRVKTDITTSNYGSTYTGDHADTVEDDGTAIVGDSPIYYYSTAGHNNVKFGNFCWQIVRTTDTGGIKLLYNGIYNDTNKCNNSGYIEGEGVSSTVTLNVWGSNYYYATSYSFDKSTGKYSLTGTINSYSSSESPKYGKYSCLSESSSATCDTLYYMVSEKSTSGWTTVCNVIKYSASSWNTIGKSAFNNIYNNRIYVGYKYKGQTYNDTDSTIKTYIDNWYSSNMTNLESYLEDTVFCNDRTGSMSSNSPKTGTTWAGDSSADSFYYHNFDSTYRKLFCDNVKDRFSTNNSEAKLSHPIGLITQSEYLLLDSTTKNTGQIWWLLSPRSYSDYAYVCGVNASGILDYIIVYYDYGARPSVSLVPDVKYSSGSGSVSDPYIVDGIGTKVTYVAGSNGTLSGTSVEEVSSGGHPTGRDITPNEGYTFMGWVANKDVTLSNNDTITKGTVMTKEETQSIVISESITLTAKYYKYLYDQVKEDVTTNNYGGEYTDEHADSVQNDGTAIEGSKNIYYYSTAGHNNVKFGDYCWQIIRTTDTGGVKLVYNGTYSSSSKCNNSGTGRTIGESVFNSSYTNRLYVGYKYKTTNYNDTNSTMKTYIDSWYESNLSSYESYLEDTVFCNDRTGSTSESSAATGTTWAGDSSTSTFYYHNDDKNYDKLSCDNEKDRFSTNNSQAQLSHPIGLVTEPERKLLDSATRNTGQVWWLLSPISYAVLFYSSPSANLRVVDSGGSDGGSSASYKSPDYYYYYIRPSVSLAPNITFEDGTGTTDDPYIVGDIVNPEITATFYYQSSTTNGEQTISSKTETCTPSNGSCSVTIPSEVKNSVGKYNNSYAGLSTNIGTMSTSGGAGKNDTSVTITGDTTFYATYSSSVTNYYYN